MAESRTDLLLRTVAGISTAGTGIGALLARGLSDGSGAGKGQVIDGLAADKYPNPLHTVNVNYKPGHAQFNAMLQRGVAERAAKMQTLQQHNETLLKYLRPGMDAKAQHLAIMRGVADEQALPEYWDDKKPRVDYTPSSSAVKAIRITPDNRVEVMWGSTPKWYTYKQHADPHSASMTAHQLITAPSIGRALIRKSKKPGVGDWGRAQYDGAMAV